MAPKHQLDKAAWDWAQITEPENITDREQEIAYRINLKCCSMGSCRRNCKGNPRCLFGLGEREWLADIPDENWNEIEDPLMERRMPNSFAGLKNLGATCYVNCLLQLWFHNPVLRKAIYQWKPEDEPDEIRNKSRLSGEYHPSSSVAHLQLVFALLQFSCRRYIDPTELIKSLGLNTAQQQDAQEFSKLFMNLLEEKLQYQRNPYVREIVQTQFRGEYCYVTTCVKCQHSSTCPSTFYELDLNITGHKSLNECVEEFLGEERLEGDDQYFCSYCENKQNATRRIKLTSMPPVLNLQLLRFIYDRSKGHKKKLNSYITFPEFLNMNDYVNSPSECHYDLSAVLIHRGPSAYSGHYIAHIKDRASSLWYRFNDETIEQIKNLQLSTEDDDEVTAVKGPKKPKLMKGHHSSQNAYMLVYTKRSQRINAIPSDTSEEWDLPEHVQECVLRDNSKFEEWVADLVQMRDLNIVSGKAKQSEVRHLYNLFPTEPGLPFEWIPSVWLVRWLSSETAADPVDNSHVLCSHSNLNPDCVPLMKCISAEAAAVIYGKYGGGPRLTSSAICHECVVSRCRLIRIKCRLQIDYKFINSMSKTKLDSTDPNLFWVGRSSLRSWRKFVLDHYSLDHDQSMTQDSLNPNESIESMQCDEDDSSSVGGSLFAFNEDIVCTHDRLSVNDSSRRLISPQVWSRLKQYFPTAPEFSNSAIPCSACQVSLHQDLELRRVNREIASEQKNALIDLYLDRNRPIRVKRACGVLLNAVNAEFVDEWRKFVRDPSRRDPPIAVDNGQLVCPHDGLRFVPRIDVSVNEATNNNLVLVWANEWDCIRRFYSVDRDVTVTCECISTSSVHPFLVCNPDVCVTCNCDGTNDAVDFTYATIFVRKANALRDANDDGDGEWKKDPTQAPCGKKKRVEPPSDDHCPDPEYNSSHVRRSTRHRRVRGEVELRVSSTQTLRDLKLQIMKEFSVAPFDQHLSLDGRRLTDNEATLASLRVLPTSRLVLEVDEVSGHAEEEFGKDVALEEGFKGTELLRS